jgi:hypothetical protein
MDTSFGAHHQDWLTLATLDHVDPSSLTRANFAF